MKIKYVNNQSGTYDLYLRHPADGTVWKVATGAWVAWVDNDIDDYNIEAASDGGKLYSFTLPAGLLPVSPILLIRLRAGANPAAADLVIHSGNLDYSLVAKILKNKAIWNKSTGVITYYDDDGATALFTITPTEGDTTITRTPS